MALTVAEAGSTRHVERIVAVPGHRELLGVLEAGSGLRDTHSIALTKADRLDSAHEVAWCACASVVNKHCVGSGPLSVGLLTWLIALLHGHVFCLRCLLVTQAHR